MTQDELALSIREYLADVNTDAAFFDGLDEALLGVGFRFGVEPVALYDSEKCIEVLMKRDGMTREEADDFFGFNIAGAWLGQGTPMFGWRPDA